VESVENSNNPSEFSTLSTGLGNPAKSQDAGFPHYSELRTMPGEVGMERGHAR